MKYKNGYKSEQYLIFEVPYDTTVKLLLDGRLRLEIVNKIDATADNRV